jgi:uncharacterized protein YqeY
MTLQEQIKENIKKSMLEKNSIKLDVLRGIGAAFMNELVAKGRKPQDVLTDEEALAVITRIGKQRKDSIDQFEKAGRMDLADEEKAQYEYIKEFLPELMSEQAIRNYIEEKKSQGLDITQKNVVMKTLMTELKGRADGQLVKSIIDSL